AVDNQPAFLDAAKRDLPDNEGVDIDLLGLKQFDEPRLAAPNVVNPDRRVGENHVAGRRRGAASASGSEPPSRASLRAASRCTSALSASRTSADFSSMPVYSRAAARSSS